MFEQSAAKSEKDRSQTIMILSGLAVLLVIILIIVVSSLGKRTAQADFAHAGSPEFDSYAPNIKIGGLDKRSGERMNYRYARILCNVENAGDAMLWESNKVAQRADRKMGATAVVRRSHFLVGGG